MGADHIEVCPECGSEAFEWDEEDHVFVCNCGYCFKAPATQILDYGDEDYVREG